MSDPNCCKYLLFFIGSDIIVAFYLWTNNFYLLHIRLNSCYMMINVLQLILVISMMMMDLLIIVYLLGSRHVVLHLTC